MIAVDAMGGDRAPHAIVEGAVAAARKGVPLLLCGKKEILLSLLPLDWQSLPISLEYCSQQIDMTDEPSKAIRAKKDSSLIRAMNAVTMGNASAFFSAGNSGAVLIASVIYSGRVRGIHRPAVGTFIPGKKGAVFCIDVGGNVDCKAAHLYQFALMGHLYVQQITGIADPRVGLLSNGHESFKGSSEAKKVHEQLLHSSLSFVGNIEPRDISDSTIEVAVCDGLVGNVMLKAMQATVQTLFSWMKEEAHSVSWLQKAGLWLTAPLFHAIKKRAHYASVGGALLLGVNNPVIIGHGRSDAQAVENGILFAHQVVQEKRLERFNEALQVRLSEHAEISSHDAFKIRSFFT